MIFRSVQHLLAVAAALLWLAPAPRVVAAENLTPLGKAPDWPTLAEFHETITRAEFERLLRNVYCTRGVDPRLIEVEPESVRILMDRDEQTWFSLRFAADEKTAKKAARSWRPAAAMPKSPAGRRSQA
jgi:hypothetical protein